MSKSILAYFKSENDAESARANLQRLRVSDLYVDKFPEEDHKTVFVPLLPWAASDAETSASGAIGEGGEETSNGTDDDDRVVSHLLEGQVEEDDYEEALQILSDSKGYKYNE